MKSLLRYTLFTFLFFGVFGVGFGQDFKCGTPERPKKEVQQMQNFYKNYALQSPNLPSVATQYIYIKFHNVRRNTADRDVSGSISTILNTLNTKFASLNVQFLPLGSVNNIYSSIYYDLDSSEESDLRADNDYTNALNIYFVGNPNGSSGYARYPTLDGNKFTNAAFMQTNVSNTVFDNFVIAQTLPHELGHYFNLYHTFGNNNGGTQTSELVNGSNCPYAGDEVCDTPADPYIDQSWFVCYNQSSCSWNCINTDANGQRYNPSMNNFMSYYQYCRNRFTSGQFYRMSGGLNLRNNVSIDFSQRYYLDGLRKVFISPTTSNRLFCGGSSISFDYGIYGEPNFVNAISSVRLTNTVGGYYDLGNLSLGQNFKTITIPTNIPTGYYKLSINNSYTSPNVFTDVDIYINGTTNGTPTGSPISSQYSNATSTNYNATSTCLGNSITLYGNIQGYDTYWWTKDGQNFTASSTDSYFNASSTGTYTLNMIKCGNVYRSSNSIYLTFYNKTTPSITASIGGVSSNTKLAVCDGSIVGLSSGCQGGMNPIWQDGNTSSFRYYNASSTRDFVVSCSNYFCNSANSPPVRITTVVEPNIQSVKTGNWQAPDTWSCNCVPLNCQNVTVQTGHTVSVPVTDAKAKNITVRGVLNFQNPTPSTKGKVGVGGS